MRLPRSSKMSPVSKAADADLGSGGFLGLSPDMVERTYGHHHSAHLRGVADAVGRRNPQPDGRRPDHRPSKNT
jgi:hypothetical protein